MIPYEKLYMTILMESSYDVPEWLFPLYQKHCDFALTLDKTVEKNIIQMIVQLVSFNTGLSHLLSDLYVRTVGLKPTDIAKSQGPVYIISCSSQKDMLKRDKMRKKNETLQTRTYETDLTLIYALEYDSWTPGKYRDDKQFLIKHYYTVKDDIRQFAMIEKNKNKKLVKNLFDEPTRDRITRYMKTGEL